MFESFRAPEELDVSAELFKLQISYDEPDTGDPVTSSMSRSVAEILGRSADNIRVAEVIHLFTALMTETISRSLVDTILGSYPTEPDLPVFLLLCC
jgi:hypothetical protein